MPRKCYGENIYADTWTLYSFTKPDVFVWLTVRKTYLVWLCLLEKLRKVKTQCMHTQANCIILSWFSVKARQELSTTKVKAGVSSRVFERQTGLLVGALSGGSAKLESPLDWTRTRRKRHRIITDVAHHTDSKSGCPLDDNLPSSTGRDRPYRPVHWTAVLCLLKSPQLSL